MTKTPSKQLVPFLAAWESPGGRAVTKAYRCPAGVVTIGHGATNRSSAFRKYWIARKGHQLRMGDTITQAEADDALLIMLREEYAPPVDRALPDVVKQHEFDAATDMTYNCGPGAMNWKWAKALTAGDVATSAKLLKTTATTANGKKLAGLVRRRSAEAGLMIHGYPDKPSGRGESSAEVKEYQAMLKKLGHYSGDVDGINGDLTKGAVKNFQRETGLVVDGIVGPATIAALIRALDSKKATATTVAAGGVGAGGGGASTGEVANSALSFDLTTVVTFGVTAAVIAFAIYWLYRNRGRVTGRRVPT